MGEASVPGENSSEFDPRWAMLGLSEGAYDEKVRWLGEQRKLGPGCDYFFRLAGRLYGHARSDFEISGAAFFHAVIGVERALRNHYLGSEEVFSVLFGRAVDEGVVSDAIFSEIRESTGSLLQVESEIEMPATYCERLAIAVPRLRNSYFHGGAHLSLESIFIAVQLREVADVLETRRDRQGDLWGVRNGG